MGKITFPQKNSGEMVTRTQLGYGGLSLLPSEFRTTFTAAASTGYFVAVGVPAGSVITNVVVFPSTAPAGTNPTAASLGVLDSTGMCVATTADIGTSLKSGNPPFSVALSSTYSVPNDTLLYFGYWMQGSYGSTQPSFYIGSGANSIGALGSNAKPLVTVASVAGALTVNTTYTLTATNAVGLPVGWS